MADEFDVEGFLRWALDQLQQRPARYRCFGIYWWAVKAALKRWGYTAENLYMLGDYRDPDTAGRVPSFASPAELLAAALAEYERNLGHPLSGMRVEDDDGEFVVLYDRDAGL